ncbi:MAG: hypothetical protein WA433_05025 [Desulfobaccales bacterium]
MSGRKTYGAWIVALALLSVLAGGCNGVIYQKQRDNGQTERVIIDQGGGWDSYNITPRYYSQNPKDLSDFCIMLRNERTF